MSSVIVIGAGIVGAASALALHERGFDVTVVDQQSCASDVSSATYANGAQLSYAYVEPLANASTLFALPKLLWNADSPLRFKPRWSLEQWRWGLNFLRHCNHQSALSTTQALLALGQLSHAQLMQWQAHYHWQCSYAQPGKLVLFNHAAALKHAADQVKLQAPLSPAQHVLSARECALLEPALRPSANQFSGGVYTPTECVIDGRLLARAMTQSIRLLPNTQVTAVLRDHRGDKKVVGVKTTAGDLMADAVVIASGYGAAQLLQRTGLKNLIYPIKGYSISLKIKHDACAPKISITDTSQKLVYARLQKEDGNVLRVAGRAELGTSLKNIEQSYIDFMCVQTNRLFDGACSFDSVEPWVGQRPATASGRPIVGATPIAGLFVNVGHGALGLTMACGAAALLTAAMTGQRSQVHSNAHSLVQLEQQFKYR